MPYHAKIAFNSGELSPKVYGSRYDVEKYARGCIQMQNMFPTKYGTAERRPGTYYIDEVYDSNTTARLLPFIYSSTVFYKIEAVHKYFRFFYGDAVLEDDDSNEVVIQTPYEEDDLFQLQHYQIGDVMWLVNSKYEQRTLSRTTPETFELSTIDFRKGPFLTRNDLLDPANPSTTTLTCSVTEKGQIGTLVASASVFFADHVGALFKLVHPRADTIAEVTGDNSSDTDITELEIKGTLTFVTHGTWTGTVYLQRKDNDSDWEDFRTYKSTDDKNIQLSHVEKSDNIKYRILTASGMSAAFGAELTVNDSSQEGIVKVIGVADSYNATVEVYKKLASTDSTKRWHEGAWSGVRGWPSVVTFCEERCVYAGATAGSEADTTEQKDYPSLLNITF